MLRRRHIGSALGALAILAGCADLRELPNAPAAPVTPPSVAGPSAGGAFLQTFGASPAAPRPWQPTDWDVTVHSRDSQTWDTLEPMQAEHGANCGAPPATHPVSSYEDTVFVCKNHLMTAINAKGYGVIYLTPDRMVDFSAGEAVIRFDLSTLRHSERDWVDVWITPYADNLQLPLDDWLPDLNGPPRNAVHIRMDVFKGATVFKGEVVRDFKAQEVKGNWWTGYEKFLAPSAQVRTPFELRISRTHLRFGMPQYNFWWVDADIPALNWARGVVQFGHHSYNPLKGCADCEPNTWHWNNFSIDPSIPFTILHADRRMVDAHTAPGVRFPSPAPAHGHLRFAGIGQNLEVSFDEGRTWQPAELQAQKKTKDEHFRSYWMPLPAGTTSVQFRGKKWWGGSWLVRDISIWTSDDQAVAH